MTELKKHPLCDIWPEMTSEEKTELIADVKDRGVIDAIIILDGQILDGYHRYKASIIAGRDCPMQDFIGQDPISFVIAKNAMRRHLSKGAIAVAVARTRSWSESSRYKKMPFDFLPEKKSTQDLAEEIGVSKRTMQRAIATIKDEDNPPDPPVAEEVKISDSEKMRIVVERKEREINTLENDKELLESRLAMRINADSDDVAQRDSVVINQQNEIKTLKSQVASWQTKYNEAIKTAKNYERQAIRLQKQIEKIDLGAK